MNLYDYHFTLLKYIDEFNIYIRKTRDASVLSTLDWIDIRKSPIFRNIYLTSSFQYYQRFLFFMKIFIKKKKKKKGSYQLSEIELHMGEIFPEFFLSVKLKEDSVGLDKSNKL